MIMLKRIFQFIISHSVFIALCSSALSLQTLLLLRLPVNVLLLLFIFFATIFGYNAYWLVSKFHHNDSVELIRFFKRQTTSLLIIILSLAGMAYAILYLHLVMYNIIITFLLLALYSTPLWLYKKYQFIRRIGFLKTILLAFTWAHITTLIPLQKSIVNMQPAELLIFMNRFLFMLILCIIFDKRDAVIDKIRGLHSLATDMSPAKLHWLIVIIFSGYFISAWVMKSYGIDMLHSAGLLLAGILTIPVYFYSQKKRSYIFYYFIVDGMMILSAIITSLISI